MPVCQGIFKVFKSICIEKGGLLVYILYLFTGYVQENCQSFAGKLQYQLLYHGGKRPGDNGDYFI
jgi:hypothetical protein